MFQDGAIRVHDSFSNGLFARCEPQSLNAPFLEISEEDRAKVIGLNGEDSFVIIGLGLEGVSTGFELLPDVFRWPRS
jgi:hypothetical protein